MKEYKYILFDLDGTVTDPGVGITNSVMYALKGFGIEETDRKTVWTAWESSADTAAGRSWSRPGQTTWRRRWKIY